MMRSIVPLPFRSENYERMMRYELPPLSTYLVVLATTMGSGHPSARGCRGRGMRIESVSDSIRRSTRRKIKKANRACARTTTMRYDVISSSNGRANEWAHSPGMPRTAIIETERIFMDTAMDEVHLERFEL